MLKFLTAKSHNVKSNFTYIDWPTLQEKVKKPSDLGSITAQQAKDKSPILAANDAPNKQKDTVLLHDHFTLLRLDLDDTKLGLDSISDTLDNMGLESFIIHTTASHLQEDHGNRFRVYIQLAAALNYSDWAALESYLSYVFRADDCASRPQQIMYLPVLFKNDNYEFNLTKGNAFTAQDSELLHDAKMLISEQLTAQETANKSTIIKPCVQENLIGNQVSIIAAINKHYEWENLLLSYGYIRQGTAYLPPEATSKKAGAYILKSHTDGKQRYYSHHESDPCATGKAIDQFDFIVIRSYHGNSEQAIKEIAQKYFSTIDSHNKKEWTINKLNEKKSFFNKAANS
jgi:hypothetical protein